jgi:hypothetical protein
MIRFVRWLSDWVLKRRGQAGQFADVHDSFAELLRTIALIEWIGASAGLPWSDIGSIRERSTTIAVVSFVRPAAF